MSPARQRQAAHVLLKTILQHALKLGLIPRNPLDVIDKPRVERNELQVLTPDEARKLLKAAEGHRLEVLIVLALATGARQGELFGLQWRNVELERSALTIQRTLIEVRGHLEFGEPKTGRSRRRVDLPDYAVRALRVLRANQQAIPHPTMLIFTDTEGEAASEVQLHQARLASAARQSRTSAGQVPLTAPQPRDGPLGRRREPKGGL